MRISFRPVCTEPVHFHFPRLFSLAEDDSNSGIQKASSPSFEMLTRTSCSTDSEWLVQAMGSTGRTSRGGSGKGRKVLEYKMGVLIVDEDGGTCICMMDDSVVMPMSKVYGWAEGSENKEVRAGTTRVASSEVE